MKMHSFTTQIFVAMVSLGRRRLGFSVLFVLFCLQPTSAIADSSVWKIDNGAHHLYLAGTMHILGKEDYPLPAEFNEAYADSASLIFETDIAALESPAFQAKMIKSLMYQDGTSLTDFLESDTLAALKDYLKSRGIPSQSVMAFKPGMVMSIITVTELHAMGLNVEGVDAHFYQKGLGDKRELGELETTDDQLAFMAALGEKNPDRMIRYTLEQMSELPSLVNGMRAAWRDGDMGQLSKLMIEGMRKDFPDMYQSLLVERNNLWMPKLKGMLNSQVIEMVLVGAGHLTGESGLLSQLRTAGYTVSKL